MSRSFVGNAPASAAPMGGILHKVRPIFKGKKCLLKRLTRGGFRVPVLVGYPSLNRHNDHLGRVWIDDEFEAADVAAVDRPETRGGLGGAVADVGRARGACPGHSDRIERASSYTPCSSRETGLMPQIVERSRIVIVGDREPITRSAVLA
jgi:hypothetical protein